MSYGYEDDPNVAYELFEECKAGEPDSHWYLDPLCQSTEFVKERWEEPRAVCGAPAHYFEHNDIVNPESMDKKHAFVAPTTKLVWGENAWRANVCKATRWKPDAYMHGEPEATCSCPCHWGSYFVNIYQLSRECGGPEEGGWWYDTGTPVGVIPAESYAEAERLVKRYEKRYPSTGARYSMAPRESDYRIVIERTFGEPWPEHTPRYE
jgi:hypothetical protein